MRGLVQSVQWAWGAGLVIQVFVCGLLFFRRHFRTFPTFTTFVVANVFQAILLYLIYKQFGLGSGTALTLAWFSEACILLLRSLATMEILHLVLKPYRGIWGLGWRLLTATFCTLILYAAIEAGRAGRDVGRAIRLADKGFHLAFAAALVACLVMIRYYSIPVEPTYKALLGGFCFYSCTMVIANAVGYVLTLRGVANFEGSWQLLTILTYAIVQVTWAAALWKASPAQEKGPTLLPPSIYGQLSPLINDRLGVLNARLSQFWKPEVSRH
jgi:hypothetical protein